MDLVKQFREYTRQLECHLGNMNQSDCCCYGISTMQFGGGARKVKCVGPLRGRNCGVDVEGR